MNVRTKVDVETRMKMAVDLIELLHKRIDGLTAEVEMLRRKVFPKREYVRRTPEDAVGESILEGIIAEAAASTGLCAGMIRSNVRVKAVTRARQWVMYEACARGMGYSQIGRLMGRNHTTVMHAVSVEAARRLQSGADLA